MSRHTNNPPPERSPAGRGPRFAYGTPGTRVLPDVISKRHRGESLPIRLARDLGVAAGSNWDVEFSEVNTRASALILATRVEELLEGIAHEVVFSESLRNAAGATTESECLSWLLGLPLSPRTSNLFRRCADRFGGVRELLLTATFDDLLDTPNFGVISLLDLLVVAEAGPEPAFEETVLLSTPPYAHLIRGDDPRFSGLLGRWRDLSDLVDRGGTRDSVHAREILSRVQVVVDELAGLTIENEGVSILAAALGTKRTDLIGPLSGRFGLNGRGIATLSQVGDEVGLTTGRIQQICAAVEARLPSQPVWAPAVEQMLALLQVSTPITVGEFARQLRAEGLTQLDEWHAAAITAVAQMSGRTVAVDQDGPWLGTAEDMRVRRAALKAARMQSNAYGITSLSRLKDGLAAGGFELSDAIAVLRQADGVHFLDKEWFWTDHAAGRNRLVNTSLRILAVIEPQTIPDMREGIDRNFTWRASSCGGKLHALASPHIDHLKRFFLSHPAFAVSPDWEVSALLPIDEGELGPEKLTMVRILRAQPHGAMHRNALLSACADAGMSVSTAGVFISYAECIKHFGRGVWGLRGLRIPQDAIDRLQTDARTEAAETESTRVSGVTQDGRLWFARRVGPTLLFSGVMGNDWERDKLTGRAFALIDASDGEPAGRIRFAGGFNHGYTALLRRSRAKVGDVLRVVLDLGAGTSMGEVGGDELFHDPFG